MGTRDPDEIEAMRELDELLDDADDELEARFRELEADETLRRFRDRPPRQKARRGEGSGGAGRGEDPLADLKSAVDGRTRDAKTGRAPRPPKLPYLLVLCPSCGGKNRVDLERVRTAVPRCGRCRVDLVR